MVHPHVCSISATWSCNAFHSGVSATDAPGAICVTGRWIKSQAGILTIRNHLPYLRDRADGNSSCFRLSRSCLFSPVSHAARLIALVHHSRCVNTVRWYPNPYTSRCYLLATFSAKADPKDDILFNRLLSEIRLTLIDGDALFCWPARLFVWPRSISYRSIAESSQMRRARHT